MSWTHRPMVGCFARAFLYPHEIKGFHEPSALWHSDDAVPILPVMGRIGAVTPEGRILKLPRLCRRMPLIGQRGGKVFLQE